MTKITEVSISNYLSIKQFKIDKLGKLNQITGGNGKGKTAIEKAITDALSKGGLKREVIRTGQDKAEIIIKLDSGLSVRRRYTQTGSNLEVKQGDERVTEKPQQLLNDLLGRFVFDPTEFYLADAPTRRSILLSAIDVKLELEMLSEYDPTNGDMFNGVDFDGHGLTALEECKSIVYDKRAAISTTLKSMRTRLSEAGKAIPENFDEQSAMSLDRDEILLQMQEAAAKIVRHTSDLNAKAKLEEDSDKYETAIQELESDLDSHGDKVIEENARHARAIELLEETRQEAQSRLDRGLVSQKELEGTTEALATKIDDYEAPNLKGIKGMLDLADESKKILELMSSRDMLKDDIALEEKEYDGLNTFFGQLKGEIPRDLLMSAKLPVDDLTIDGDNIMIDGVSIETMSTSERVIIAVEIAKALAGDLMILLIDRFESLDEDAREAFEKKVLKEDFQLFTTRVTKGPLMITSRDGEEKTDG